MCGRNLAKPRVFIVFVLFLTRAMDLRLFSGHDYTFICGWSEPTAGSASLVSLLFLFFLIAGRISFGKGKVLPSLLLLFSFLCVGCGTFATRYSLCQKFLAHIEFKVVA